MKTVSTYTLRATFVLPSLSPGGAERVMITLMNGLNRKRFSPSLLSIIAKDGLSDIIHPEIPQRCLNQSGVFRAIPALYKALKAESPDIVISTMAHMNFAILMLKPFFPKTKFIVREAISPSYFLNKGDLRATMVRTAYKILYPHADSVIAPSRIILNEFETLLGLGGERYTLLYNPVDTKRISSATDPVQTRSGAHSFVASGRLHPQKGFDRLIVALKDFKPAAPWTLDILGEGDQREELQSLIEQYGLTNKILLRGHITNPWKHYAEADCLLLPSRWEGLPNVALESLACGTPVIAMYEAGGVGEIAEQAGAASVQLAQTMDEFICLMDKTGPKTSTRSLFPDAFGLEQVVKSFETILVSN